MKNQYFPFILYFILSWNIASAQIYVDSSAIGANNGMTWDDAFNDLQDALNAAQENDTIRVAEGTYRPDIDIGNPLSSTFSINANLVLLGGFNATSGEQNPDMYETILSGDLIGDDIDDDFEMNRENNVYTVLTIYNFITNETIIDGFTISHGHAGTKSGIASAANGGGIYSTGAPVIRRCTFNQNYALNNGGAIEQIGMTNSEIILDSCFFHNNSANTGAAVRVFEGLFNINGCMFQSNIHHPGVEFAGGTLNILDPFGGTVQGSIFDSNQGDYAPGMLVARWANNDPGGVMVEILYCSFINNASVVDPGFSAVGSGGLLLFTNGSNTTYIVKGSTFENNICLTSGGGIALAANNLSENASILIDSCRFFMNEAYYNGCGIYTRMAGENVNLNINRCDFIQNTTIQNENPLTSDSGVIDLFGTAGATGTATVDSCYFEGNSAADSGAIEVGNKHNGGAFMDYFITNSIFKSNEAQTGGAISIACNENGPTNIVIENCEFTENIGTVRGGAIDASHECNTNTRINRCTFTENESPIGAVMAIITTEGGVDQTIIENSLIKNNSSENGVISLDSMGELTLLNCTISENPSTVIAIANQSTLILQNTIFNNPDFTELLDLTSDNLISSNGGNLVKDSSMDALLIAPSDQTNTSPDFDNDGFPLKGGNLVNRGINSEVTSVYDIAMNPRIQEGIVDIGAYESPFVTESWEIIEGGIQVSPNPVSDFLHIQLNQIAFESFEVSMLDSQGRLLKRQLILDIQSSIYIGDLPNGFYSIKILDGHRLYLGKFVKQ